MGKTYKESGVDIDAGESAVQKIAQSLQSTYNENVLSEVGHFGGFYRFDQSSFTDPVLVSSTDGVGTKLKLAFMTGNHRTIGQDLVNHCVNDILTSGATPLFFLDYIGIGTMDEEVVAAVVEGLSVACRENGCALIGGELAELREFYHEGEYDMAGTIVGVVERENIINGSTIREGDIILGLPSNGLHTNGYTLARQVLLEEYAVDEYVEELGCSVGEEMLRIHRSYLGEIQPLVGDPRIKGIAHVTGGGLLGNTRRIVPDGLNLNINRDSWEMPPVFHLLQKIGEIPDEDLYRTFNCGIGMVLVMAEKDVKEIRPQVRIDGEEPVVIGEIVREEQDR